MSGFPILSLTASLVLFATGALAAPSGSTSSPDVTDRLVHSGTAVGVERSPGGDHPIERPIYGPILSDDPLVRAQVKRLYLERHQLEKEAMEQLRLLGEQVRDELDRDFRVEIQHQAAQLKVDLERTSMELGLEIARLNDDEQRVTDFERALDQLNHPEKYRPAPIDPSILEQRLRDHGVAR